MRIEIRHDSVLLDGYVNVVQRDSRPLKNSDGSQFIERIEPHAFERAIKRATNVLLLLNHDDSRVLGSSLDGSLNLREDSIGLRATCTVTDAEVIKKAKEKKLRGWSFGFYENRSSIVELEGGMKLRKVEDLDLIEVSIIDEKKIPCYQATSIEQRAGEKDLTKETRAEPFEALIVDETKKEGMDYSEFENRVKNLKNKGEK